jgi:hypothetical protein
VSRRCLNCAGGCFQDQHYTYFPTNAQKASLVLLGLVLLGYLMRRVIARFQTAAENAYRFP